MEFTDVSQLLLVLALASCPSISSVQFHPNLLFENCICLFRIGLVRVLYLWMTEIFTLKICTVRPQLLFLPSPPPLKFLKYFTCVGWIYKFRYLYKSQDIPCAWIYLYIFKWYYISFGYTDQRELSIPGRTVQYKQLGALSTAAHLSICLSFNIALRHWHVYGLSQCLFLTDIYIIFHIPCCDTSVEK